MTLLNFSFPASVKSPTVHFKLCALEIYVLMHLKLQQSVLVVLRSLFFVAVIFSFLSARSCSPVYLLLFLSHSVPSKSIFYTVQLIAEFRKMPFENLSPDVLLIGQRIPRCSSGQLPQDRKFWEMHDKLQHV